MSNWSKRGGVELFIREGITGMMGGAVGHNALKDKGKVVGLTKHLTV